MAGSALHLPHLFLDLHDHLLEVPSPPAGSQALEPAFPDLGGEDRTEAVPPMPVRFMSDIDAAVMPQTFDRAPRLREPSIRHDGNTDAVGRRLEALEGVTFGHA
ncbi:hypothetical protein [Roseivivax lentus]|uniref:hypothetical protein n=1 Tax=Roseivivax lentus TaxID=633194 RepID=UPI00097144CB|nr:hypothetical protein [Roseivivax lentus]